MDNEYTQLMRWLFPAGTNYKCVCKNGCLFSSSFRVSYYSKLILFFNGFW